MNSRTVIPALLSSVVVLMVSACAGPRIAASTELQTSQQVSATSEVLDSNGMRPGVVPQTRVEPPSDADRPDGPPPLPDAELTAEDLAGLIRTPASAVSTPGGCTVAELRLVLSDAEPALGHRYAQLVATNMSERTCELVGWPGLGLRGAWGTAMPVVPEQNLPQVNRVGVPQPDPGTAVTLPVGGRAVAEFEWTGALAGNRDEHVSLVVVELTTDGTPAAIPVDSVDIGPDTTVRIGPWGPIA